MIDETNKGRRVELIHTDDPYTKLKPGAQGTYQFLQQQQTIPVSIPQHSIKWDSGSTLMLLEGSDRFKFLDPCPNCGATDHQYLRGWEEGYDKYLCGHCKNRYKIRKE
jgi:hypothetical protein